MGENNQTYTFDVDNISITYKDESCIVLKADVTNAITNTTNTVTNTALNSENCISNGVLNYYEDCITTIRPETQYSNANYVSESSAWRNVIGDYDYWHYNPNQSTFTFTNLDPTKTNEDIFNTLLGYNYNENLLILLL